MHTLRTETRRMLVLLGITDATMLEGITLADLLRSGMPLDAAKEVMAWAHANRRTLELGSGHIVNASAWLAEHGVESIHDLPDAGALT